MKSCLRLKKAVEFCCDKFGVLPSLAQKEWNSSGEFESIINDTSKLIRIYQNEEKLNGACGPVMRKVLYDGLSCGTIKVVNTEQWSSKLIYDESNKI